MREQSCSPLSIRTSPKVLLITLATFLISCRQLGVLLEHPPHVSVLDEFLLDVLSSCPLCGIHGSCLINRCICDSGYEGNDCTIFAKPRDVRCVFNSNDDVCMNTERYGRLKVASPERQRESQECETNFWKAHAKPTRNYDQLLAFESFQSLPIDLGHVVEVGAGPYTKIRLILEESNKRRQVKSITLVDPLLNVYMGSQNITTSYPTGKLCSHNGSCIPTTLLATSGETRLPRLYYDAAILVNTLEHCQNAVAVLNNIYHALKSNGILVFGETFATAWQLRENDKCHPIRPTRLLFDEFLAEFSSPYLLEPRTGEQVHGVTNGGARKSLYAIVRK